MAAEDLVSRIGRLLGQEVASCKQVAGGYTPATRLLCRTAGGSFFAKAGSTPLTAQFLRREIQVYNLVRGEFMPELVGWEDHETEPLLIIEDLSSREWPPPWDRRRVELVLEQAEAMHGARVDSLERFSEVHGDVTPGWRTVGAEPEAFLSLGLVGAPWLGPALPLLIEYEGRCRTDGDCLTHFDLRSDNICLTESRAVFVDWNNACLSHPLLDLGFWLPSLAHEGGPEPERILPDAPEIAAFVSGYFAARAGLAQIPDAPRVRLIQLQQLETALPWAARALGLPPPDTGDSRYTTVPR
jgi:thiamine kinase-like enzyme